MPVYQFRCHGCDKGREIFRKKMNPPKRVICKTCHKVMYQYYSRIGVGKFTPYTTEDVTGKPIEFTSPKQRDEVLAKHGLTMDTNKYGPRNKVKRDNWEDSLDFNAVKELAEKFEGEYEKTGKRRTEVSEDPELAHLPLYPKNVEMKKDA